MTKMPNLNAFIFAALLSCAPENPGWRHLSTETNDLEVPNEGNQQTALLVADLDEDGFNDFVVAERTHAPALVWYRRTDSGWDRYVINSGPLKIEAGSTSLDVDGDGDQDIIFGGDVTSNQVWWWENPYPDYDKNVSWKRYLIRNSGETKHHDQLVGDFDGDGSPELVFWNQNAHQLVLAEIPDDPKQDQEWPMFTVYEWKSDREPVQRGTYPAWKLINEREGLSKADIDGDGIEDIVGGGAWFKYISNKIFEINPIDSGYTFTRCVTGQLVEGGRPEVVLVVGDGTAPLIMYEWKNGSWEPRILVDEVVDGHSICTVDFNGDGHLDIFNAEMGLGHGSDPKARILLGDGKGNFKVETLLTGYGMHESLMADMDGDGDLDILGKPYSWKAPRLDIWLNEAK
jgi:FG-GAP-like repeat